MNLPRMLASAPPAIEAAAALAVLALAAGIGFQHWVDDVGWTAFAPGWLLGALLPVLLSAAVLALVRPGDRRLGPVPRVAAVFAAGGGSMLAVIGVRAWLGVLPTVAPHDAGVLAVTAAAAAMAIA